MQLHHLVLSCAIALAAACPARAVPYAIQTIASGSLGGAGVLANGIGSGSINNGGTAAYTFRAAAGLPDLWTGDPSGSSVLYDAGVDFFAFNGAPLLNNMGDAAFTALRVTGGNGVFIGDGGPATTIALDKVADPLSHIATFSASLDANDSGRVAFQARLDSAVNVVYSGNGGPLAVIADTSGAFFEVDSSPAINNSGTVSFRGRQTSAVGPTGIFTGSGGPVTTLYTQGGTFASFDPQTDINDTGVVAFRATLPTAVKGIFKGSGGATTTVVDNAGPFSEFLDLAINSKGMVAFEAKRDATGERLGIYTGPDPVANKVIAEGDSLLGGTVILVDFFRGLNDKGQIVFHAGIDTGLTWIDGFFVANPIIPGDVNGDLMVDIFDINFVSANWGGMGPDGDANGDHVVNIFDINLISAHWGEMGGSASTASAVAVPEPATIGMMLLAGIAMLASRRRRRGQRHAKGSGVDVGNPFAPGQSA